MKRKRAFAIPLCLCVAGVVLFLGASTAQLCAGDLQVASHEYYQERARQVADFALESGVGHNVSANGSYLFNSTSQTHRDDVGRLTIFDNTLGGHSQEPGCPVKVPDGFQYWVAQGEARSGGTVLASVRLGAMVQLGQPEGSAGAQVRYLSVDTHAPPDAPDPAVTYIAVDNTGAAVPDKIICSTPTISGTLPSPTPPEQYAPMTFHKVKSFGGVLRLPLGADYDTVVSAALSGDPTGKLNSSPTGGMFNIPNYSPPTPVAVYGTVDALSGNTDLPPGEYAEVRLNSNASVTLRGAYHIHKLVLAGSPDAPPGALVGAETGACDVYLDKIVNPNALTLGVYNMQTTADAFRLNIKPPPPGPGEKVKLAVQASASRKVGSISLVAPKHVVDVTGLNDRMIRGSFCCELLSLHFKPGADAQSVPYFVYDTTADRSRNSSGRTGGFRAVGDPPSSENQPMILSKNPLP